MRIFRFLLDLKRSQRKAEGKNGHRRGSTESNHNLFSLQSKGILFFGHQRLEGKERNRMEKKKVGFNCFVEVENTKENKI